MNIKWVGAKKTAYDALGGSKWFEELVEHFYENVEVNIILFSSETF